MPKTCDWCKQVETEESPIRVHSCGYDYHTGCHRAFMKSKERPEMTDETYAPDTVIYCKEKTYKGCHGFEYLKTPDNFYTAYSGFKVIHIFESLFLIKQFKGYPNVEMAQIDWHLKHTSGKKRQPWILKAQEYNAKIKVKENEQGNNH